MFVLGIAMGSLLRCRRCWAWARYVSALTAKKAIESFHSARAVDADVEAIRPKGKKPGEWALSRLFHVASRVTVLI